MENITLLSALLERKVQLFVEVHFYCGVDHSLYLMEELYLRKDDRDVTLDLVWIDFEPSVIRAEIQLSPDVFHAKSDLTLLDVQLNNLDEATARLTGDYEVEPEHASLFVVSKDGTTQAIELAW